jgi:Mg2+/citrate symporter
MAVYFKVLDRGDLFQKVVNKIVKVYRTVVLPVVCMGVKLGLSH